MRAVFWVWVFVVSLSMKNIFLAIGSTSQTPHRFCSFQMSISRELWASESHGGDLYEYLNLPSLYFILLVPSNHLSAPVCCPCSPPSFPEYIMHTYCNAQPGVAAAVCQHILLQRDPLESHREYSSLKAGCAFQEMVWSRRRIDGTSETDNKSQTITQIFPHIYEMIKGFVSPPLPLPPSKAGDLHAKLWSTISPTAKNLH